MNLKEKIKTLLEENASVFREPNEYLDTHREIITEICYLVNADIWTLEVKE